MPQVMHIDADWLPSEPFASGPAALGRDAASMAGGRNAPRRPARPVPSGALLAGATATRIMHPELDDH